MKALTAIFSSLLLVSFFHLNASGTITIKSPDGHLTFLLFEQKQHINYQVLYNQNEVIASSPLQFSINGKSLTQLASLGAAQNYFINEKYPVYGVHSTAENHCKAAKVIIHSAIQNFIIEIRVFNDGVSFRQIVAAGNKKLTPGESTVFNIPSHSVTWYHDLYMHYEGVHQEKNMDTVKQGEWAAPPATFKTPAGIYASITEAALVDYPGMALQSNGNKGFVLILAHDQPTSYPYKLRYSPEDTLRLRQAPQLTGTITTPWRVIIIGKNLNSLVNSDIITNLNHSPAKNLFPGGITTNWIRPGRAVWKYLNGGGDGTVDVMKHFTDAAAALGFEHNILEGFWTRWTDDQIRDLVNYSKSKGVGIWLWKHSKSLRSAASRDSFFRKCSQLGVTGAKIDFFDHEAKEVIDLYQQILKTSARYHILLDFHGANKPTGLSRTYPNLLTVEAVKGMEASKLTDRATHETTLPFTRFLAGPAEYTVMHFGDRRKNTSWAHQVASAAILSAPLLTYAANPDSILNNPAVEIIKDIPSTWDETIVLPPSEIGELAVYARRKGDKWFLAIMNGVQNKKISCPLTFLKGQYSANIAKDDPTAEAPIKIEKGIFSSKDFIHLDLTTGGGFIAEFTKNHEK
jgi:alpha-glucosidase